MLLAVCLWNSWLTWSGMAFDEETTYPTILTHLVGDGANLLDPENVKMIIAHQKKKDGAPWSDSMKLMACCAYDAFCQMPVHKIAWERPHYTQSEITIMAPDEKDLDALINAVPSKRMATFLLCLKETFADPSEIIRCEWTDLNGRILSINHPVKHHYSGKYELSLTFSQHDQLAKKKRQTDFRNKLPIAGCLLHPSTQKTSGSNRKPCTDTDQL